MITFIVPTIGRKSLERTVNSIKNQSCDDWKAIIIFDGIKKTIEIDDDRISYLEIEKKGFDKNNSGSVRNEGIKLCTTEWIGFVDDDDTISPYYIENLKKEIELTPSVECVIFRMLNTNKRVLPSKTSTNFYGGDVGISFSIKNTLIDAGHKFIQSDQPEDFKLLNRIRSSGHKIVGSSFVSYFVRCEYSNGPWMNSINRFFIN